MKDILHVLNNGNKLKELNQLKYLLWQRKSIQVFGAGIFSPETFKSIRDPAVLNQYVQKVTAQLHPDICWVNKHGCAQAGGPISANKEGLMNTSLWGFEESNENLT